MRVLAVTVFLVCMAAWPSDAQEGVPSGESRAWDMERAFEELERLQAEVVLLRRLGEAQAALLAWNRERAGTLGPYSGAGPAVLSARLCAEPGLAIWCRALPATFGADAAGAARTVDHGHGRDGER